MGHRSAGRVARSTGRIARSAGRIALTDVGVSFDEVVALRDVGLAVEAGTSVALIGPNGSGKTTLLDVLAGLVNPTRGSVEVEGRLAYVLQRHDVHRWMPLTVAEVMGMGRYRSTGLLRPLRRSDRAAIAVAADRLEVGGLMRRQFGRLSGGQRQRVRVAQALVQEPTVLLMDEPITGLDLASQQRILQIVAEETAEGSTVVLSTHHLEEARRCDRAVLLAGRVVADGSPGEVMTAANLQVAYGGRALAMARPADVPVRDIVILDDHGHGTDPGGDPDPAEARPSSGAGRG